ncbi:FG-GAP-like repeat-containing protein [Sphingomonas sp.]|uniref:FG-GAP-like repeat-containing protein n=1 Tax=Sphingomonas sp. TaxID=28214 RepID=UPI00286C3527|nr:FG-GAP-like repeat-containing protein [Sphingomonas sp.]
MVDIPGDTTTTATISLGGSVTGSLETIGDHDWFRLSLTVGQEVTIALNATTIGGVADPYLRVYAANGSTLLFENDDGGTGTNSLLSFKAATTGVYFIDAAAFNNAGTGNYQLSVSNYVPPSVATSAQISDQLVNGYWGGRSRHFNVSQGGSITVNLTALAADGQALARQALSTWTDLIGVRFVEVSSGGQIGFADSAAGASTSSTTSGGLITHSDVNISTQWLIDSGNTVGSYGYQTYLHEIGHALGLGHAGNYNDTATYPYDALFANDSWALSIMSYFDQRENTYTGGQGFTLNRLGTPMIADILAVQTLYGLSTSTRTGDTIYGYNTNAGNPAFDAVAHGALAYTIYDSGGNDTIDYSGSTAAQKIDLTPGNFSNVNGYTGNVAIAPGVIIENALGGSGADALIGNGADNILSGRLGSDILTGGVGADLFRDTATGLNGDTITDFAREDRIVITDGNSANFSASISGNILTYSGGSLTLTAVPAGRVVVSAATAGVQVAILGAAVLDDFNGDGRSDILWRNDDGSLGNWLGTANGGFTVNGGLLIGVSTSWHVAGTGDFNGDGRADILWRNDSGELSDWLGNTSGGFTPNNANASSSVATSWKIVGTGDFDGDGRDDILWRNDDGTLGNWLGTATGGFSVNGSLLVGVANRWQVVGTGDFNGDGRADVLWRSDSGELSDWLGTASGGLTPNNANSYTSVSLSWKVVGTGDFNGDGRDDILWRNGDGTLANWLGTTSGGFTPNNANSVSVVATSWHVAATADYNGDGRDDILWRNDNGALSDWLGTAAGGFTPNNANAATTIATSWHVQSPDSFFV